MFELKLNETCIHQRQRACIRVRATTGLKGVGFDADGAEPI